MKKYFKKCFVVILMTTIIIWGKAYGQTYEKTKDQVKEYTLSNGMKFIVLERHDAPVISFHTYADVGSSQEVSGITGISHLLEHMAFKGTTTVGTKDYDAEKKLLDQMDKVYVKLKQQESLINPDSIKIKSLHSEFDSLKKASHDLVITNEYNDLYQKNGGTGINAYTSDDATQYINSLPSNRLEFWMAIESDRFMNPVFRDFFEERNVVMEERRLGLETQPVGKLIEDFIAAAFKSHPYHHSVVGHMSDLRKITRTDVEDYFHQYYCPSNLVTAIVGEVKADEVFKLAQTYFSRIPSGPKPEALRTEEPEQWGERRIVVEAQSQPIIIVGYHRPSVNSKENFVFDGLANILGQGRSSRVYQSLVKEKKIAIQVGSFNGFPGTKYPNLFAVYAVPAVNHTSQECLEAIEAEITKMKTEPIKEEELTKYKRQSKKSFINSMKSNGNMAGLLTYYDVIYGNWNSLFDYLNKLESITTSDIQKIAQKYLIKKNRTIGEIIPEK
jgi:predicted Zn-dependent peptidase